MTYTMYYYDEIGWCPRDPLYSTVEIADVGTLEDLFSGESFVKYDDLITPPSIYSNPTVRRVSNYNHDQPAPLSAFVNRNTIRTHRIFKPPADTVLNPHEGTIVPTANAFRVVLAGRTHPNTQEAWKYFGSTGLDVYLIGHLSSPSVAAPGKAQITSRYRVCLKKGYRTGHLQFVQTAPEGMEVLSRETKIPYGTILNLFVTSDTEREISESLYPPVLSLMPFTQQTFVPLFPEQILQVVTPEVYTVGAFDNSTIDASVRLKGRCKADVGKFDCYYYRCHHEVKDSYPIFFHLKHARQKGVIVVPPIVECDHKRFAVLTTPLQNFAVLTNNIDGIVIRTKQPLPKGNYLDQRRRLLIKSAYQINTTSGAFFDTRISFVDKTYECIHINNLNNADGCSTKIS